MMRPKIRIQITSVGGPLEFAAWECGICRKLYESEEQAKTCESIKTTPYKFEIGQKVSFRYGRGALPSTRDVDNRAVRTGTITSRFRFPPQLDECAHYNAYRIKFDKWRDNLTISHTTQFEDSISPAQEDLP
jgi:hypothetical protein